MKPAQVLKESAEGALALLKLTCAAADVFPPLKGAAGGALHIAEMVKKFKSNEEDWNRFGDYVAKATACVIEPLANVRAPRGDLKVSLEKLCE